jgi:hypothetical protein
VVAVSGVLAFEHCVTPTLDFDVRWFCRATTVTFLDTAALETNGGDAVMTGAVGNGCSATPAGA